ncbi:hypothetical protein BJV74DRAFT_887892 [Russula compacta]|nr:hypothetical protein BJV74DRAFT_887892 [Russula compacta]
MDQHALAVLEQEGQQEDQEKLLNWSTTRRIPESGKQGGILASITPKLLYYLILESQKFGGGVLDQFWDQLGSCNSKLKENIEHLREKNFESSQSTVKTLSRGLNPKKVDYGPMLKTAAEYFTHLVMNPGGRRSGTGTEFSVSEIVNNETDELLQQANEEGDFGKRKQEALKALSFRRDGIACLLTGSGFQPFDPDGVRPALAHIVPDSAHGKPDTLKCIAMFAGAITRDVVMNHLNSIGNVMNMELNAHGAYDNFKWGIEAEEEGGEVKYFFRTNPTVPQKRGPGFTTLREGDEIQFGRGRKGEQLNKGPINLQLAVASYENEWRC